MIEFRKSSFLACGQAFRYDDQAMTTRRLGVAVLVAVALLYVLGFLDQVYLFLVAITGTAVLVAVTVYFLTTDLVWHLTPSWIKARYPRVLFSRIIIPFLAGGLLLLRWTATHYFFRTGLTVPGTAGFFLSIFYYLFVAAVLLLRKRTITILKSFAAFAVLMFAQFLWTVWSAPPVVQESNTEELQALPYLDWGSAKDTIEKNGVVHYDADKSFAGLNLYNSRDLTKAYLIDMNGRRVHEWKLTPQTKADAWQHVEIDPTGDLYVLVIDVRLLRLDWRSNIKWKVDSRFHHDFGLASTGDIYCILRKEEIAFLYGLPVPCLVDHIVVLSSEGKQKSQFSLLNVLRDQIPFRAVVNAYSWLLQANHLKNSLLLMRSETNSPFLFPQSSGIELFHTNAIEIMEKDIPGFCKKKDLLVSFPVLNLVGIIDMKTKTLGWNWGKEDLKHQHNPTLLENGHVLIFDNGLERKYSRIVEVDPATGKIVWEYRGSPPEAFYTLSRGGCQRLPNGNTLITESDTGRVFEVTAGGETVWEFFNPDIDKKEGKRGIIFRMTRIIDPENYHFPGRPLDSNESGMPETKDLSQNAVRGTSSESPSSD